MKYTLNLVREIQNTHRQAHSRRVKMVGVAAFCFGLLALSFFYGALQVFFMRAKILEEEARVALIKTEYERYEASTMIVNKADVERLDRLQNSRIFWTKKLVAMAQYLPENFWISRFAYDAKALTVEGYGFINYEQRQLITLDEYLNSLRGDKTFSDVFNQVFLNATDRNDDEHKRQRVSFSYAGIRR